MHFLGLFNLLLPDSFPISSSVRHLRKLAKIMVAQPMLGATTSERVVFGKCIGVALGDGSWTIVSIKLLASLEYRQVG